MTKATITTVGNMSYLDFFNSKEVYTVKGFDTIRKAKNYAKKWGIVLFDKLPENIQEFQYND